MVSIHIQSRQSTFAHKAIRLPCAGSPSTYRCLSIPVDVAINACLSSICFASTIGEATKLAVTCVGPEVASIETIRLRSAGLQQFSGVALRKNRLD